MNDWYKYENLESGYPYEWKPAWKGDHVDDNIDFHVDLGAGKIPKGRLSIDRHGDVDIVMDLDKEELPFKNNSIKSIISHHCLEHIGNGFIPIIDECYRVLEPGGIFRIISPFFPSIDAIQDPDHKRYFCQNTFESFCHEAGPDTPHWTESFSVPYTKSRFSMRSKIISPAPEIFIEDSGSFSIDDLMPVSREIRVSLQK